MANDRPMRETLIREFTDGYLEKLFYFCLRRTGNPSDAEDLASEITLNILTALNRGIVPNNFSAWVWAVARNRYGRWAEEKHNRGERLDSQDVGEYEIEDGDRTPEEQWIHSEELSLLRRELAFISRDYREIVVAFYIEDRKIRDIAASLSLPEGTVKARLSRARKILKEGSNMAREFGKLSYKPENITFITGGNQSSEPWSSISRLLDKNIMLAAYRTPSTAEELAVEVGVALPYMEEELNHLTDVTLMRKNGDKYETAFFIVSREARERINAHLDGLTPALTQAITDAVEYGTKCYNENDPGWNGGFQSDEDVKWTLLMQLIDRVEGNDPLTGDAYNWTKRPDNCAWDVLGMEEVSTDRPAFVGEHGSGTGNAQFWQYKFNYHGLSRLTPDHLSNFEVETLSSVIAGDTDGLFQCNLDHLEKTGFLVKTENGYRPTFLVIFSEKRTMTDEQTKIYAEKERKVAELIHSHYAFCREQIQAEIPDALRDDRHQLDFACSSVCNFRGAVLEEALRTGYLTLSDEDEQRNKALGAYMIL